MWLLYAVGSALFAGLTSILAKCGIRKTDSTVATAIRTIIVLIFAWVMVFVVGSQGTIASIPGAVGSGYGCQLAVLFLCLAARADR